MRDPFPLRLLRARPRRTLAALLAPVVVALVVAGCGGGGGPSGAASLTLHRTSVGTVLADSAGRTLYLFKKDKPMSSACYGACASIWPPLTTKGHAVVAGKGVSADKLGTAKRRDGTTEVTYAGHPLYTYEGDAKPGDARGQGLDQFGAEWDSLPPSGAEDSD